MFNIIFSVLIPFIGTMLGSACVFLTKDKLSSNLQKGFSGFAAGVMVAASIWSLIIPSYEQSQNYDTLAFLPVVIGLWLGFVFLMILDKVIPHLHLNTDKSEGLNSHLNKSTMMTLAVALHNLPEGMAVGVVLAAATKTTNDVSVSMAIALAIGIAIQNFPEGAIISIPLKNSGINSKNSFLLGVISGIIEPLAAILTMFLTSYIIDVLPYLLSFAAGAMLYVVVEELVPEMSDGEHSHIGTIFFGIGFSMMFILDCLLA